MPGQPGDAWQGEQEPGLALAGETAGEDVELQEAVQEAEVRQAGISHLVWRALEHILGQALCHAL